MRTPYFRHPGEQYASEGGPAFKECFALLRRVSALPAIDVLIIFNLIAGNADAHGKNFSILYDVQGARLAPLYDLLATVAYPDISPNFRHPGGRRDPDLQPAHMRKAWAGGKGT